MSATHVPLAGSRRPPPPGGIRLRDVDAEAEIDITVTLKGPALPDFDAMPSTALDQAEVERLYGVPHDTLLQVENTLRGFGLRVRGVRQGGRSLRLRGSASAMREAFQADFGVYQVPGQGRIRARQGELQVPAALDGLVTGVFGIDQRRVARRHRVARGWALLAAGAGGHLAPADLRQHYAFPAGEGAGQRIAIAEFGDPQDNGSVIAPAFIPSDVEAFCAMNGLPTPAVEPVSVGLSPISKARYDALKAQDGDTFADLEEASIETMMDAQIVAGLCPQSSIDVYFAPWGEVGWVDMIDEATSGAAVPVALSISYGLLEEDSSWSQSVMERINHRLQLAALRGVTVCVSSGDDGTFCGASDGRCHVEFPASSPFVLSVGGTEIGADDAGVPAEVVWNTPPGWRQRNTDGGAPGGGVSRLNPRPTWQTVDVPSLNPGAPAGRIVPDVAALAGAPFYAMMFDGAVFPGGGGTSAAAPLWAALIALVDAALPPAKRQRFWPPLLYKPAVAGSGFTDITSGDNAASPSPGVGYAAGPGFDAVSGWGTPKGVDLLAALQTV